MKTFKKAKLDERSLKDMLFLMYNVKHQMVPGYFENIFKRNETQTLSFQDKIL